MDGYSFDHVWYSFPFRINQNKATIKKRVGLDLSKQSISCKGIVQYQVRVPHTIGLEDSDTSPDYYRMFWI